MKKNLYYRQVFRRRNALKEFFLNLILALSSWPRLLLEVFIRRNFGERYFSLSTALLAFLVLLYLPTFKVWLVLTIHSLNPFSRGLPDRVYGADWSWYLFLYAFLGVCLYRRIEIMRATSVFDLQRFSLSTGDLHPFFLALRLGEKPANLRLIETVLEPGLFFGIGYLLTRAGLSVGPLLMVCSLFYSVSYLAAYHIGDNFVLDHIDEMICNQQLTAAFVDDADSTQTNGVRYYGRRPTDPDTRRQLAASFTEESALGVEVR